MKTIILTIIMLCSFTFFGQTPTPNGVVKMCNGITEIDVPENTYFKDVDNDFDKFTGTWKWENGNEIVVFQLAKIEKWFDSEFMVFEDFLAGNYSYSNDGGNTYVVNTIPQVIIPDPEANPLYSSCPRPENKIRLSFKDVVLNKDYANVFFEFLPGSTTQMQVKIRNDEQLPGRFVGDPPYNYNFTLPTDMIVTKQ